MTLSRHERKEHDIGLRYILSVSERQQRCVFRRTQMQMPFFFSSFFKGQKLPKSECFQRCYISALPSYTAATVLYPPCLLLLPTPNARSHLSTSSPIHLLISATEM